MLEVKAAQYAAQTPTKQYSIFVYIEGEECNYICTSITDKRSISQEYNIIL